MGNASTYGPSGREAAAPEPVNEIVTERLILRQVSVAEASAVLRGVPDPKHPMAAGYPLEGTREAFAAFLQAAMAGARVGPFGPYQIIRKEDGVIVGDIGFHGPPDRSGTVRVGYGLAPPARGHGYVTEALRALIGWALRRPEVRQVEADTTHGNTASQRVLRRAGMREIGRDAQLRYYRYP